MLMPILLCTGNIPLLLGHLGLTATSVCWPARGTPEAQGDEEVDWGDEEARKGEQNILEREKFWAVGALCNADPAQVAATAERDDGDEREKNVGDEEELWAAIRERDIIIDKRTEALEDALDKIEDLEKELSN